jgi:hypothetical protein
MLIRTDTMENTIKKILIKLPQLSSTSATGSVGDRDVYAATHVAVKAERFMLKIMMRAMQTITSIMADVQ